MMDKKRGGVISALTCRLWLFGVMNSEENGDSILCSDIIDSLHSRFGKRIINDAGHFENRRRNDGLIVLKKK